MTSQHKATNDIKDPFDLLDKTTNVVPVLSKGALESMITKALEHEQIAPPADKRNASFTFNASWSQKVGWLSGGIALAACLILMLAILPNLSTPLQPLQNTGTTLAQVEKPIAVAQIDNDTSDLDAEEEFEISEMMFYDTLYGF
ncbi:MAG: hypothetical protein KDJ50_05260 [Alphaproteobacteria bacterium]|nr:hypothetical protein [Alphaproteobacteria bacterium]